MEIARILIVEDNLIVAEDIKEMLVEIGYEVVGIARTYERAIELSIDRKPNLALIDIQLASEKDGINFAQYLDEDLQMPFLFVTANADPHNMQRAKRVHPWGYVLKPFRKEDLYVAIEIALFNFGKRANEQPDDLYQLKSESDTISLSTKRIKYFKGAGNYVEVHLLDKKLTIRATLNSVLEQLPSHQFLRVHRSYIINKSAVSHISSTKVQLGAEVLPIGRSYRILPSDLN